MRYLTAASLLAAVLSAPGAALADPIEDAIKARQGFFTMLGANLGPLSAMAKGEMDYDEAAASTHGANLETLSKYTIAMHFPAGSSTDDLGDATAAKGAIWSNLDDFKEKFANFQSAAVGAGESVKGGRANVGSTLQNIGITCKGCHDEYRVKE